jgi:hypothetical protein
MDAFGHLNTLTDVQLYTRRNELVGSAPNGDYRQLTDLALQELVAISRILRRKTSPASRARKSVPTLDAI